MGRRRSTLLRLQLGMSIIQLLEKVEGESSGNNGSDASPSHMQMNSPKTASVVETQLSVIALTMDDPWTMNTE